MGQGVDTKSDKKQVIEGKLIRLQDGVFTEAKRIQKRPGNDALDLSIEFGSTVTNPVMTKAYYQELIIADEQRLYSYSPSAELVVDKGPYQSVSVNSTQISINTNSVFNPSVASLGNYSLFSYTTPNGIIYASVRDNVSDCFLIQDVEIAGSGTYYPKSVLLSGTTLGVIYGDASNNLLLRILSITGSGAVFAAPVTIGTNVNPDNPSVNVSSNGSFNVVVYIGKTGPFPNIININSIDASGSSLGNTSFARTNPIEFLIIEVDASHNAWVYWVDVPSETSESIFYTVYDSTITQILTPTSIIGSLSYVSNLSANNQSNGHQFVYYSTNTQSEVSSDPNYVSTFYAEVSTTAVISSANAFLLNVEIQSNWVTINGSNYAIFANTTGNRENGQGDQNTFFLIREVLNAGFASSYAVAKCLFGEAVTGNGGGFLYDLITNGENIYFAAPFIFYEDVENSSGTLSKFPLTGMKQIVFDFNDFEAYQSLIAGNIAALNGGIVQMYDGKYCVELGFNVFPENIVVTAGTSGSIDAGSYFYAGVYEWYDATGNFHESAPQTVGPIAIMGSGSASIDVQTLSLTQKQFPNTENVVISLYRSTLANPSILFKVGQLTNDLTVNFVTFTDTVPDSQINNVTGGDIELYTTGGILENNAPPPCMVMMSNQNRLWLVDAENPTNTAWYCKTYQPGVGLSFSDFLTITIDPRFGNITSLIGMDAYTCILKSDGIFIFTGDGFNDTGTNSTFTNPQVVPSDVGCLYSRATILIPDGVLFKTLKGIYVLSRGLSVEYFGIEVEKFNDQDITASRIAPATSQVRFLTDSGLSLVYDYIFKQWGTFSNYQGHSCDNWQGQFVYARTDGNVFIENQTTFLDDGVAYSLLAQLAWFKFASIQGFQRIRQIIMLGDHLSPNFGHGVKISAAYDFDDTSFSAPIGFTFSGFDSVFQYREFLPRQKCDALMLLIEEITTGVSGEFLDLTDLSAIVGVKRGINKLSPQESVG